MSTLDLQKNVYFAVVWCSSVLQILIMARLIGLSRLMSLLIFLKLLYFLSNSENVQIFNCENWNYLLFLLFLEISALYILMLLFLKCAKQFNEWVIWSWSFLHSKVLNFRFNFLNGYKTNSTFSSVIFISCIFEGDCSFYLIKLIGMSF